MKDIEGGGPLPCSYAPLPDQSEHNQTKRWKPFKTILYTFSWGLLLVCLVMISMKTRIKRSENSELNSTSSASKSAPLRPAISRGVSQGVSEKVFRLFTNEEDNFPWSNTMLSWQRTAFHFQPEKNWMNDPNGPLFYKGWYHLFYQYNPNGAVWGDIVWGHAVSRDLINWSHLPLAMVADQWYDINGVWTGSATILPDGSIVMLYTGSTKESVQVQNLALPEDPSDPLLIKWVKHSANPILVPPPGIGVKDFRDPTTAWKAPNGNWRITIGSKINTTGISMVYETADFISYKLMDELLHAVPGTGMWECIDFYPVSLTEENGLDTSENGPGVKHVLKASLDDNKKDYYALGTYDPYKDVWTPDNPELDVGIGLRYDWGKYYASKTFYDQNKGRRILWGWIGETDSELADMQKGWASVMTVPRQVSFDKKTKSNILQWPVHEVESLRSNGKEFDKLLLDEGSVIKLDVGTTTQLDITADFEVDGKALEGVLEADVGYNCSTSNGAAGRGALGPFGFLVLANNKLSEQTAIYFYIAKGVDGNLNTFFCTDESRSSKASDVNKQIYGYTVPVLDGEKLSVRILVDHSIVEAFAQRGRSVITSRVYPTEAIGGATKLFLFNNATASSVTASSVKIWQMDAASSAEIQSQPGKLKV